VLSGSVFALGLSLSGMTDPRNVLGFLDAFGQWDPTLAFVMLGAIGVHFSWLRWGSPASSPSAASGAIDAPLLLGAGIFGVGWGMSGYCPGPALVALAWGRSEALLFVLAMCGGIVLFNVFKRRDEQRAAARAS
jgi:uncharacterized membrane protein YedE/YeeE